MAFECGDEDILSLRVLRVKRDIADIVNDPPPGIYVAPEEKDITRIYALVMGPSDTPYEGAFLLFHIVCPHEYPIGPPRVRFLTTDAGRVTLHPNLYQNGDVSLSILGTYVGPQWSPAQSLCSVLISIQSLLTDDPFYDHLINGNHSKETYREAANNYKVYVRHEVVRVAVCDAVQSCLEDSSAYPAALRETVLKLFLDLYDRYEESVKSCLHLTGTQIQHPFISALGTYQYEALLARLQDLKAKVEKRSESGSRGQPVASGEELGHTVVRTK
ncbi:ubiquitin-conjugating enzyme E2 Z [Rhipicephalus sanguineus]|uniref:Ubiquitin-conjugating enzyme E2 Z n=1 Tax=Rhipicephalus sanguineus TaxID=34632 RepID=A0A9D4PN68_RHISA|nr:ubiquitin-conjugating enzyme E2 Z [Rhipicephalus sanguineus]KAH7948108.1 hypothetical protein HPB52_018643 [Rhipicephalus sanguineus]